MLKSVFFLSINTFSKGKVREVKNLGEKEMMSSVENIPCSFYFVLLMIN